MTMTEIIVLTLIVILVIAVIASANRKSNTSEITKSNQYKVTIDFPHPETTNDFRFFKFIESSSVEILKALLPKMKSLGIKLKPEFEDAINKKIETGEFINPLNFKDFFGTRFDLIGVHFSKGSSSLLSTYQINLCFIKDSSVAVTESYYFRPSDKVLNSKGFQERLTLYRISKNSVELFSLNDLWTTFNLKEYLNNNLIVVWDNTDTETFYRIFKYHGISDFNFRIIEIKEIALKNNLPTYKDDLLKHFKSILTISDETSLICSSLAFDFKDNGIDIEQYGKIIDKAFNPNKEEGKKIAQNNKFDFVAIDVETAQGSRWSICQIGLAFVENNELKQSISYLIQPPDNQFQLGNIRVHGITPAQTKDKPLFPSVWKTIEPIIRNKLIVAHNASFDLDCLIKTLNYYQLETPEFKYACTYEITGEKLKVACQAYDIKLDARHNAECDAVACALLYVSIKNGKTKIPSSKNISFNENVKHENLNGNVLNPDFENANPNSPFYKKKVVFTGNLSSIERIEAATILKKLGADINTSISKKTDIVIIGANPGPSKVEKIDTLNNEGCNIRVITETEFLTMIN